MDPDLPKGIRAARIQDHFFPRIESYDDFLFLDAHDFSGRGWAIARRCKGNHLPWFIVLPVPLLLIGPAKRLVDF